MSYIYGYIWYEPDRPDPLLSQMENTGITCFLRVPENREYAPNYYVINLGKIDENCYRIDHYSFFGVSVESIDQFFIDRPPMPDIVNSFTFHLPKR